MADIRALLNDDSVEPRSWSPPGLAAPAPTSRSPASSSPPAPPPFLLPPIQSLAAQPPFPPPHSTPAAAPPAPFPRSPPPASRASHPRPVPPAAAPPVPYPPPNSPPLSPVSAPSSPPTRQSDLARNRDTSSRHRANKRQAKDAILSELGLLYDEAAQLRAAALPKPDVPTYNSRDTYHIFSGATNRSLKGVHAVSDVVAGVMLEFVALRRGIASLPTPSSPTPEASKRCTDAHYNELLDRLRYDADGSLSELHVYQSRLNEFELLRNRFDAYEQRSAPWWQRAGYAATDEADVADAHHAPRRGRARHARAGKRCRRCGVLKSAGSGHPRSHCLDNQPVGSETPYAGPAPGMARAPSAAPSLPPPPPPPPATIARGPPQMPPSGLGDMRSLVQLL